MCALECKEDQYRVNQREGAKECISHTLTFRSGVDNVAYDHAALCAYKVAACKLLRQIRRIGLAFGTDDTLVQVWEEVILLLAERSIAIGSVSRGFEMLSQSEWLCVRVWQPCSLVNG